MKYPSEHSDSLSNANEETQELNSERSKLLNENAALRAIKTQKESVRTTTSFTKPTIENDIKHYAQATASSRCRDKSTPPQKSHRNDDKASRAISINGERQVHKAGVSTLVTTMNDWTELPCYMDKTRASCNREYELWKEREEREKRVDLRGLKPQTKLKSSWPDSGWNTSIVEEVELWPEEPQPQLFTPPMSPETTLSTEDTEVESVDTEVENVDTKVGNVDIEIEKTPEGSLAEGHAWMAPDGLDPI
ncbi:hypothetical protein F5B21DRAFT_509713 [Xylaria acuta]|nr:hypothetical protein F5B21DRAFT_509713 [Xylaria acuta]